MLPVDMAVYKDYLGIKGKFFVVVGHLTTLSVPILHNLRLFDD